MSALPARLTALLRWSEKYTKTDMVYLAESGFWIQSSATVVSLASFLLYLVFANVLSKEVFGTYQYLLSIGGIVTAITMTGMGAAVTKSVAQGFEGTYRASIRQQLLWGAAPLSIAWLLGGYYLFNQNETLALGLFCMGVFIPLTTTFNTFAAYLTAKHDFKRGFFYGFFVHVPYYLSLALLAFSAASALALLLANLISQTVGYYLAHRKTLATYTPNDSVDPHALRYGAHLSNMNFLGAIIAQADAILIFHFLGAAPLALYSFITAIPDRLSIFKNVAAVAFPKYAKKSISDVRSALLQKVGIGVIASLGIAGIYAMFAGPFFSLFFPRYIEAVPYSILYALTIAVSFSPIFNTALTSQGETRALYASTILTPLLQLLCVTVGIVFAGLWGLVIGRVLGTLIGSLIAGALFLTRNRNHI